MIDSGFRFPRPGQVAGADLCQASIAFQAWVNSQMVSGSKGALCDALYNHYTQLVRVSHPITPHRCLVDIFAEAYVRLAQSSVMIEAEATPSRDDLLLEDD